ncbi:uncharacterized protein LOC105211614 [Zeugodacus cucurbitae]|uniref:uncharacterized protein LOC105211614 n=1 Tax=Zeugodacus cucurbitae TaxID=28588 RepID=UPI000596830E|nr:uncharacterized protein LOC105211614 [Zeugodacus cucurbitae]
MAQQVSSLKLLAALLLVVVCCFANSCCNHQTQTQAIAAAWPDNAVGIGVDGGVLANDIVVGDVALAVSRDANNCFERFLLESRNASNTYASAYRACQMLGRQRRMEFVSAEWSTRQEMEEQVTVMCKNLCDCMQIVEDLEYFQCNAQHSYKSVHTMQQVYLNSSAAIVELEDKYEEAEKELLLCIISAEQQYVDASSKAFLKLSKCLKAT